MADNDALEEILSSKHAYQYSKFISTPGQLSMSGEGSLGALENNIEGLIAYVKVLTTGYGEGSVTGKPLGNKYFIGTGTKCKNVVDNKIVDRSIYFNNIPTGDIKLFGEDIGLNLEGAEFKGLMPGVIESIGKINPFDLLTAFTEDEAPLCQEVTLPEGESGEKGIDPPECKLSNNCQTRFMSINDINKLDINSFPGKKRPEIMTQKKDDKKDDKKEGFSLIDDTTNDNLFIKMYYTSLGLMLLYLLLKLLHKSK